MIHRCLATWLAGVFVTCAVVAADSPKLDTIAGTVLGVDTDARQVRLLVGVGLSLRAIEFRAAPACSVRIAGVEAQLADLARGQTVVVHYRRAADLLEAQVIETRTPPAEQPGTER